MGTFIHEAFEQDDDDYKTSSIAVTWVYEGVTVTGTIDGYNPTTGTLFDFKTKQDLDPAKLPQSENTQQIRIYANMLRHMGYTVNRAELVYISMTGASKCKSCKMTLDPFDEQSLICPSCEQRHLRRNYHLGTHRVPVTLERLDELDQWIAERATVLQKAIDTNTPAPAAPTYVCRWCPFVNTCPEGLR